MLLRVPRDDGGSGKKGTDLGVQATSYVQQNKDALSGLWLILLRISQH
jgi:hypothetical protein